MADDRPTPTPIEALAELTRRLDDMETTLTVRASRLTTGSMEMTFLTSAKPDTLFLRGQTLLRADYPVLWKWVTDNGMNPVPYGNGDGSTTFTLPDMQGKVAVGKATSGTFGTLGGAVGADTVTLATGNMPSHTHGVSVDDHGAHQHGISGDGSHGGHMTTTVWGYSVDVGGGLAAQYNGGTDGFHNHGGADGNTNISGHNLQQSAVGSSTPFTVAQAGRVVNFLVWT